MSDQPPDSQKILWLVDDNEELRSIAEAVFADHPLYSLRTFPSSESAFEAASRKRDIPDALLLDIQLPGMSGIDDIPHFKKIIPQTKIIILSNFDRDPYIQEAFEKKVDGYLLKPFDIEEVLSGIDAALHGGARIDAEVMQKIGHLIGLSHSSPKDYGLTEREVEVLQLLRKGYRKAQIAEKLNISVNTVKKHLQNVYQKLKVHSEAAALVKLIEEHILPDFDDSDSHSR